MTATVTPGLIAFISLVAGGAIMWYVLGLTPRLPPPDEQRRHVEAALDAFLRAYGMTA